MRLTNLIRKKNFRWIDSIMYPEWTDRRDDYRLIISKVAKVCVIGVIGTTNYKN